MDRINTRFGTDAWRPIVLLEAHHEPAAVYELFRAADVCYVNSLHDGMNLVAKEFVSARDDRQGVLILSQFAGAAQQLTGAVLVNPYDRDGSASALAEALRMPRAEQSRRIEGMRTVVAESNSYWWASQLLHEASRVRRGVPSAVVSGAVIEQHCA
jgi:trehalose 6-phosphate synthase